MMIYPDLMLELTHDRHRDLVAEADRAHILRSARRRARSAVEHSGISPTRHVVVTSARTRATVT
jgi:hypothetical protein